MAEKPFTVNFLVIIILTMPVCASLSMERVFSISPSFDRSEILDAREDWYLYQYPNPVLYPANTTKIQQEANTTLLGDIRSVSYISDSRMLNVTFWLSKMKGQQDFSTSFDKNPSLHSPVYGVYIDIDANKKTGRDGIDYDVQVSWNKKSGKWEKIVQEQSAIGNVKILNNITNYKNYDEKRGYITISLDLSLLNNPKQYIMTFYMKDFLKNNEIIIWDFTNWVNIPPPQYSISTTPSSFTLRPGEEKRVQLQMKQIGLPTRIQPYVNISNTNEHPNIDLDFIPNSTYIPVNDVAVVMLKIKASENVLPDYPYRFSIRANVSYPTQYVKFPSENIVKNSNLTVTMLPHKTSGERLTEAWNEFGSAMSGFLGLLAILLGIGGTIGGWIYGKSRRKNKSSQKAQYREKHEEGWHE